jgi:hypothetical protein
MSAQGDDSPPPAKKSRKFDGSMKYGTKYQVNWSAEYPVAKVKGDEFSFRYLFFF